MIPDFIRRILSTEAVMFTKAIVSVGALLIAFGLPLTGVQVDAFAQAVASAVATLNLLLGLFERQQVFSANTHDEDVAAAYQAGYRDSLPD